MTTDSFFKWAPVVVAAIQLLFLPIIVVLLRDQVEKIIQNSSVFDARVTLAIKKHNDDIYSHPALADLKKLEDNIADLTEEVKSLGLKIERLTPRRSTDFARP